MPTEKTILTQQQLAKRVPYSRTHIARLERAGDFPKRVRLGPNRVGWLASEVEAWIVERAEARTSTTS